jgi:hypothetical protein
MLCIIYLGNIIHYIYIYTRYIIPIYARIFRRLRETQLPRRREQHNIYNKYVCDVCVCIYSYTHAEGENIIIYSPEYTYILYIIYIRGGEGHFCG